MRFSKRILGEEGGGIKLTGYVGQADTRYQPDSQVDVRGGTGALGLRRLASQVLLPRRLVWYRLLLQATATNDTSS